MRHSLVDGFEGLFKGADLELPCVISVRNFDVFRVIKQLANALSVRSKFWQESEQQGTTTTIQHYYAILFDSPITGKEIGRLIEEFERQS